MNIFCPCDKFYFRCMTNTIQHINASRKYRMAIYLIPARKSKNPLDTTVLHVYVSNDHAKDFF